MRGQEGAQSEPKIAQPIGDRSHEGSGVARQAFPPFR